MENLKKYLPWLLLGGALLFLLSRMRQSTTLVPQTQLVQTPQPDAFAEDRASAFAGLLNLAGIQTQAETARAEIAAGTERAKIAGDISSRAQDLQYKLGLRSLDVDLEKTDILADVQERLAEYNFLTRENDRQIQQGAINRYNSSRSTAADIIGSISQALSGLFNNRGGSGGVFTPTTFPRGGGFF